MAVDQTGGYIGGWYPSYAIVLHWVNGVDGPSPGGPSAGSVGGSFDVQNQAAQGDQFSGKIGPQIGAWTQESGLSTL